MSGTRLRHLARGFLLLLVASAAARAQTPPERKDPPVRREDAPPRLSLYLPIPLDVPGLDDPATGVFVSDKYKAGKTVDVILLLRGYDIKRPKAATAVAEYWNSPRHQILRSFQLREEVNKSGKNVVLVVPPLGPFSEAGKLTQPGGLKAFLNEVMDGLRRHGPHADLAEAPKVHHLILAAHSGGGVPLRRLAQAASEDADLKDRLRACWGFDSIYGVRDKDAEFWADWAAGHPGARVAIFYLFTEKEVGNDPKQPVGPGNPADHKVPTGTTGPALDLERLARARKLENVSVIREEAKVTHAEVPRAHLADLLKAATFLDDR
jgi:hypothetical protein